MNILHISHNEELNMIKEQLDPFACLLQDEFPCTAKLFRDCTSCISIALVGRGIGSVRRGKQLIEMELSKQYGCPVRLFKNEDQAQEWLTSKLQVATH